MVSTARPARTAWYAAAGDWSRCAWPDREGASPVPVSRGGSDPALGDSMPPRYTCTAWPARTQYCCPLLAWVMSRVVLADPAGHREHPDPEPELPGVSAAPAFVTGRLCTELETPGTMPPGEVLADPGL